MSNKTCTLRNLHVTKPARYKTKQLKQQGGEKKSIQHTNNIQSTTVSNNTESCFNLYFKLQAGTRKL